ncbi:MAG: hypothetical protein PVS3B3_34910 [Ktedonobacteraceae bacterium]
MPSSTILRHKRAKHVFLKGLHPVHRGHVIRMFGVFLLLVLVCVEFISLVPQVHAHSHTSPTVDTTCKNVGFSPDGNPFPLCPGPFPTGGNCVWWAWEQWHLLGYDLPLNWGNAADWIVDAERAGLPLGTTPRVGAIAVFPRADGVWAYGMPGHVAFVTSVSDDGMTFNVTYQNYGDPTPMYVGTAYSTPVINQARFQNGQMRFIYFPKMIDPQRFQRLPGIGADAPQMVLGANRTFASSAATLTGNRITLGSQAVSSDQEFNADFTGSGYSDLLLYNRQQGRLDVLKLSHGQSHYTSRATDKQAITADSTTATQVVGLSDATTAVNKWGSSLDVHIGDFDGSGHSEILLYDRVAGTIQILSLTPQCTIKKHVILSNWGSDWELYVGRFDGQRSGLFMYKRYAQPDASVTTTGTSNGVQPIPTDAPTSIVGPSPTAKPKPSPTAKPKPKPSPTAKPKPSPTATPKASPTVTPTVKPSPTASQKSSVTVTLTPKPKKTGLPTVMLSSKVSYNFNADSVYASTLPSPTPTTSGRELSGSTPADWEKAGRTANILVLDFNKDFSVHMQQQYTLWHANWEVYVGRFVNANQDGIFLYDRLVGEGRVMDFDTKLLINHYQEAHNLDGNWVVYSGDFTGVGRSQLLMYDPGTGAGQMLAFAPDLTLAKQVPYSKLGTGMVPYVGHFGLPNASVMLYDPQGGRSTFLAFDGSLAIAQQTTVQSWGQRWQILVGAFLDRERCLSNGNCSTGDDILVLDRQTGQIEQYVFSFGRKFQVYDNRSQAFIRQGIVNDTHLNQVNTTMFSLLTILVTNIRDEELY